MRADRQTPPLTTNDSSTAHAIQQAALVLPSSVSSDGMSISIMLSPVALRIKATSHAPIQNREEASPQCGL